MKRTTARIDRIKTRFADEPEMLKRVAQKVLELDEGHKARAEAAYLEVLARRVLEGDLAAGYEPLDEVESAELQAIANQPT